MNALNTAAVLAPPSPPPRWAERAMPKLAPGETLVWSGRPDWRAVACHAFHIRAVALYFAALTLTDMVIIRIHDGDGWAVVSAATPTTLIGAGCLLILGALAWATRQTTRYVVTNHRIIMLFGMALPATLVIPLHRIVAVSVRVRGDHSGDICLCVRPGSGLAYAKLWPHARPWHVRAPQPMLRDISRVAIVAPLLCRVVAGRASDVRNGSPGRA